MSTQRFKVDVGGLVSLLSSNLYSGTSVYLRELLQNAVDAITARRELDPQAPARVRLEPWENGKGLTVIDTGIGLTAEQAEEFLSTIGRTSKRDELFGEGKAEFLGQFGIGMLACFLVADSVEVISRSALPGAVPVRWVGSSDGTFHVTSVDESSQEDDIPVGTRIRLQARPDAHDWVSEESVVTLASDYGSLLPLDISVKVRVGNREAQRRITKPGLPWESNDDFAVQRRRSLTQYAHDALGLTPLATIDLHVPIVGLTGVAFVLPQAVAPGSGRHRVYVKRMLVSARESSILPEWAFFVRAVINADGLTPTASREQLREDEVLLLTRETLGEQLISWIMETVERGDSTAQSFIQTHHLALRAMALENDRMLDVVARALPFETTLGTATLSEVSDEGKILFAPTTQSYRRIAPVARAQGIRVVNAGYVYDADILARLADHPRWDVGEISSSHITQVMREITPERAEAVAFALARAQEVVESQGCEVVVRSFEPEDVPGVLLRDEEAERRRDFEEERQASQGVWGGLLDSFSQGPQTYTRTLVLNDSNGTVRRLLSAPDSPACRAGIRSLYFSAVMLAGEGLSPKESRALNDSLHTLLSAALPGGQTELQ